MSTQLPANPSDLLGAFKRSQQRAEMSGPDGDFHYLKLDKGGDWLYGADEVVVEEGSIWAVNPASLATGFAAWDSSEKVGEEMALLTEEPVLKHQLPEVGAQWAAQTAMQLKCLDGEDEGTEVVYSTTSKGGQKAFKNLLAAITAKLEAGGTDVIPMVVLEVDSYKHKKYGKIYTPLLKVVDWMSAEGGLPEPEGADEPAPEQEEVQEDKPARRQRRRA